MRRLAIAIFTVGLLVIPIAASHAATVHNVNVVPYQTKRYRNTGVCGDPVAKATRKPKLDFLAPGGSVNGYMPGFDYKGKTGEEAGFYSNLLSTPVEIPTVLSAVAYSPSGPVDGEIRLTYVDDSGTWIGSTGYYGDGDAPTLWSIDVSGWTLDWVHVSDGSVQPSDEGDETVTETAPADFVAAHQSALLAGVSFMFGCSGNEVFYNDITAGDSLDLYQYKLTRGDSMSTLNSSLDFCWRCFQGRTKNVRAIWGQRVKLYGSAWSDDDTTHAPNDDKLGFPSGRMRLDRHGSTGLHVRTNVSRTDAATYATWTLHPRRSGVVSATYGGDARWTGSRSNKIRLSVHRSLSLSWNPKATQGDRIRIWGVVRPANAHYRARLLVHAPHQHVAWKKVASPRTRANGRWSVKVPVSLAGTYRFKVVAPGGSGVLGSVLGPAKVRVAKRPKHGHRRHHRHHSQHAASHPVVTPSGGSPTGTTKGGGGSGFRLPQALDMTTTYAGVRANTLHGEYAPTKSVHQVR